jgi:hypothetical protein
MKKSLLSALLLLVIMFISYQSITMSAGPPESYSNAPGEGNCANPGCHGGSAITSGTIWDNIDLTVSGNTLSGLLADSTYTFNLSFENPGSVKYGFQLCILQSGATGSTPSLGTLINTSTATQIVSSSNRSYLEHTASGNAAPTNTMTWSFDWQVPSGYSGDAVFYIVVNSSNNDGSSGGDIIYAKTISANVSLPVTWMSIRALRSQSDIVLKWNTASEWDADKFVVERSLNGKTWEELGTVKAAGNSTVESNYQFVDFKVPHAVYYRLKQVDYNGTFSISKVIYMSKPEWEQLVYFDPETKELYSGDGAIGNVDLYSQSGNRVWTGSISNSRVPLPALPHGIYFLKSEHGVKKILM